MPLLQGPDPGRVSLLGNLHKRLKPNTAQWSNKDPQVPLKASSTPMPDKETWWGNGKTEGIVKKSGQQKQ